MSTYVDGGNASRTTTSYVDGGNASRTTTSYVNGGVAAGSDPNGEIVVIEEDDAAAFEGFIHPAGTITITEEDDTAAFAGTITTYGTIAATEYQDEFAGIAAAYYDITGTILVTEEDDDPTLNGWMNGFGTINITEEGDFVDANEDFFGVVTTNVTEQLSEAMRHSRLMIPQVPAEIEPAARRYLETVFRNLQDEFNRLGNFQYKAVSLINTQIQAQQDLITTIIPLIPVNPSNPPSTPPSWNPNPTTPYPSGDDIIFTIPFPTCIGGHMEFEIQRQNLANPTWTTIIQGTSSGGQIAIPASYFTDEYTYRIRWRQVCSGVPGDWVNGDPWTLPDTWGVCPDEPTAYLDADNFNDIVAFVPYLCPPSSIRELVSGEVGQIGQGFGGIIVTATHHTLLGNPDQGGQAGTGPAPGASGADYPRRLQIYASVPSGMGDAERLVFRVGGMQVGFNRANGDILPFASISTDGGTVLAQSTDPIGVSATLRLFEAYLEESTLRVEYNGDVVASASVTDDPTEETNATWSIALPSNGAARSGIAWNAIAPTLVEELTLNSTNSTGMTTVGTYDEVRVVISGSWSYYAGAFGDAEAGFGSLSGHAPRVVMKFGSGAWTHIEPIGGPYTVPEPDHTYTFLVDAGGQTISFKIQDSVYTDNIGSLSIQIFE